MANLIKLNLLSLILLCALLSNSNAQISNTSNEIEFLNFQVSRCIGTCDFQYEIKLLNKKNITGSFKGINPNQQFLPDANQFIIKIYENETHKLRYQVATENPIDMHIEYAGIDGDNHSHSNSEQHPEDLEQGLSHKYIQLEEGVMAVRIPFNTTNCKIEVVYVDESLKQTVIATF